MSPCFFVLSTAVTISPEQNSGSGHMFRCVEQIRAALTFEACYPYRVTHNTGFVYF